MTGTALVVALLSGCGGGGGGGAKTPPPSPAPPGKVSLAPGNYQNAVTLSMGVASSAYSYSKLGVDIVDRWLDVSTNFFPVFSCPDGGAMSIELTDKNSDKTLDPGDTLHLRWDRCTVQGTTTSGLVRVELTEATQIPDGREYRLTVTLADLKIERASQPSVTVDFIAQVHFTRTTTGSEVSVTNAVFESGQVAGDSGTSTLQVNFLQDQGAQTYRYSVSGVVSSGALGGEVGFTTPTPFAGVIGEYPSEGLMTVSGLAGSAARLSEEGAAAGDLATVLIGVDTNGDGTVDVSEARHAWSSVMPVQFFAAFSDQSAVTVPMP